MDKFTVSHSSPDTLFVSRTYEPGRYMSMGIFGDALLVGTPAEARRLAQQLLDKAAEVELEIEGRKEYAAQLKQSQLDYETWFARWKAARQRVKTAEQVAQEWIQGQEAASAYAYTPHDPVQEVLKNIHVTLEAKGHRRKLW